MLPQSSRATNIYYCVLKMAGSYLAMLPVEPKLGKMLVFGAIFNCLNPILTVVAGLTVRDPFLTPSDNKDVSYLSCRVCLNIST